MPGLFDDVVTGHSSWEPVPESEDLVMGQTYRLVVNLLGPYNADTPKKIKAAIMSGAGLNNAILADRLHLTQSVTVLNVETSAPSDQDSRVYAWPTFQTAITFKKTGPGTPILIVLGIIVAIVAFALGIGFVVLKRSIQREVAQAPLTATPAILGLTLLAIVLVPLFARSRG